MPPTPTPQEEPDENSLERLLDDFSETQPAPEPGLIRQLRDAEFTVDETRWASMQRTLSPTSFSIEDVPRSKPPTPTKAPKYTQGEIEVLNKDRDKILDELRSGQGSQASDGRRAGEYTGLIKNRKWEGVLTTDLVQSEIPVPLTGFSPNRMKELVNVMGYTNIFLKTRSGEDLRFSCAACSRMMIYYYGFFVLGGLYCASCVPVYNLCLVCNNLAKDCQAVKTYDGKEINACKRCIERRVGCGNCGTRIPTSRVQVGLCAKCVEGMSEAGSPRRHFSQGMKWVSKDVGEIVKSPRIFSCEIEAVSPMRDHATILGKSLPKEMGIGTDGSLSGPGYGYEVQTPRLGGAKGEELIHRTLSAIKSTNSSVNESCGMHIHLEGDGLLPKSRRIYPVALVSLWKTYIVFEDVILSFLPFTRRNNDYCRPMGSTFSVSQIDMIQNMSDAEKLLYQAPNYDHIREAKGHRYHASRYFGVNFHSLLANGHLEIRFHTGTLNAKKILEWANLHALIIDACVRLDMAPSFLSEVRSTLVLSDKTTMLFDRIGLSSSSRQYFFSRQKKFGDKAVKDEELKNLPRTISDEDVARFEAMHNEANAPILTGTVPVGYYITPREGWRPLPPLTGSGGSGAPTGDGQATGNGGSGGGGFISNGTN